MGEEAPQTWVKLHRKVLDNDIFRNDRTAWHLFEVLLLLANRKTGSWSGGAYQLAAFTGQKKDANYKAIKRLELTGMVKRSVNARYTTYHICNWPTYQSKNIPSGKRSVNAEQTLGNTLTRIRIRNKNKNSVVSNNQIPKQKKDTDKRGTEAPTKSLIKEMLSKGKTFKDIAKQLEAKQRVS